MQNLEVNGSVAQVAERIDNHAHHYWPDSQPPDDPAASITCPQCRRLTWRMTRCCVHCQLDLTSWRRRQAIRGWLAGLLGRVR